MKVYIATYGYDTVGIFSTRQKAERFVEVVGENYEVEEVIVDAELKKKHHKLYRVMLRMDDGSEMEPPYVREEFGVPGSTKQWGGTGRDMFAYAISHKSASHAGKLAREMREEWLRENPTFLEALAGRV